MKCNDYENLKDLIAEQIFAKPFIIAIDGMSAALKTTVAERLAADYDGAVIHCDDFFLPKELRTQKRLAEPGGNIHYERMKAEVIDKFPNRLEFYTKFDCSSMSYGGRVDVPQKNIYIVEGTYALHPYFGKYYDISIFMKVSGKEQIKRITLRNGAMEGAVEAFVNKWIPMEKMYNQSCKIEKNSNIVVDTTDWRKI